MDRPRRSPPLALAAALALAAVAGGCKSGPKEDELPAFDPRGLQGDERGAAGTLEPARAVAVPETLGEPYGAEGTLDRPDPLLEPITATPAVLRLDLREVVRRAVVNNQTVRVQAYNPAIEEARVIEAEARFDPTLFGELTYEQNNRSLQALTGFTNVQNQNATARAGVRQLLPSGGQIETRFQQNYFFATINPVDNLVQAQSEEPAYYTELSAQLTQPLLRDFGTQVNSARIDINRNNQSGSFLEFRQNLEQTLARIEQTYWQLAQAQREVEIQQELLERTLATAKVIYDRIRVDVTREQISTANSALEQRRAGLIRAQARVADLSDQLKNFMNDPTIPVASPTLLLPDTEAVLQQVIFDPEDQVKTALTFRPELGRQQLEVDSADIAAKVASNNELPRLDLIAEYGVTGFDDQYGNSIQDAFGGGEYNYYYRVGFQFEYPLGNRAARAITRRARLQRLQAETQYRQLVDQVTLEVRQALREVDTTWQEYTRNREAVLRSRDALDVVQILEENNEPLTPDFVNRKLQRQTDLAGAQTAEATALAAYNSALANLELAKGTLLRYNNVILREEDLPQAR